ncbi:nucleoside hydrolase [Alteromonas gilva]|uniref:Nucleoside hydrolase n=1 Tax=Alteromonas gilva TaxID=2987522 RepID=A0ABT5KZK8_9ALTE|nr:nucleoside hydrolase [Alteromonas gilva]MDC8830204.1 nucleoside hydrolase [Alteromonas gilva]
MTHKIILDTDPGIDDAMAIFFAFQHPDIEVLGLTTVYGNIPVAMAARNALTLCDVAGRQDIPVTKGVAMPWVGPESEYAHFVHGDDGFGNINYPPSTRELDSRDSAQFIVDKARQHPGEITLVAIGPLGNIAMALRLEPDLPKLVKGISIMGGAAFVPGNVTPVAEANIWNDAHAADIVFSADWEVKMFGLDVTLFAPTDPEFVNILAAKNPTLGGFVQQASQFYIDFYSQNRDEKVCFFHDAFPLAQLVAPELFEFTRGNIRISTDDLNRGQTIVAPPGTTASPLWTEAPFVQAATGVKHDELFQLFIDTYAL